ncbi:hypothetical protein AB0F18_25905 [Streptomyces sp. NPDC029216]|uniref:hypothetical protein n=1 Tax=Streptomyces sp. NPDC029216 TaxID=3154701 RepID=UPI0033C97297
MPIWPIHHADGDQGHRLELLRVRWSAITEHGIRLHHRTYDHDLLAPYRGRPSPITARGGKREVHHNPHDALGQLTHRAHGGDATRTERHA